MPFFRKKKKKQALPPPITREALDAKLLDGATALKKNINELFITKSKSNPIMDKGGQKLTRQGEGYYRLETGKATLLLTTGSFLTYKNDKLLGMLQTSELDLNRALAGGKKIDLPAIIEKASLSVESLAALRKYTGDAGEKIESAEDKLILWPKATIPHLISRISIHLWAHAFIHFSNNFKHWLLDNISRRYALMLRDELALIERSLDVDYTRNFFTGRFTAWEFESALKDLDEKVAAP